MPRHVAFLRGINLGRRRLKMERLRQVFAEMGFADVATFIASGNVIFSTSLEGPRRLEARIEKHLDNSLGYPVETFLRTDREVAKIGGLHVFDEDGDDGVTIHVMFLHEPLKRDLRSALEAIRTDVDTFRVVGREYYWLCRVRTSESKVWTLPAMKTLNLPSSTARNIRSVRKLIQEHLQPPKDPGR